MDIATTDLISLIRKDFRAAWELNDAAHREDHFYDVFTTGMLIRQRAQQENDFSPQQILMAAYFHDLFAWSRNNHHELSYTYTLSTDHPLFEAMSAIEREEVALACLEHRASYKGRFSCGFSELINAADRGKPVNNEAGISSMILRAVQFRQKRSPELDEATRYSESVKHIKDKYGSVSGYARYPKLYLDIFGDELKEQQRLIDQL